jgi:ferric-dicitrate binding protein FerR (iron transport regulator)
MKVISAALLLIATATANAWEVKNFTGEVKAKNGLTLFVIKKNLKLPNGTRVITGTDGKIRLQDGGTVLKIGTNSQLTLPSTAEKNTSTIVLDNGRMRASFAPLKNKQLLVRTGAALVGVSATETYVYTDNERDIIGNLKGKVDVSVLKSNEKINVKPGNALYLLPLSSPQTKTSEKSQLKSWAQDTEI